MADTPSGTTKDEMTLDELAEVYGWGSREVQDAYDYRNALVPDAD